MNSGVYDAIHRTTRLQMVTLGLAALACVLALLALLFAAGAYRAASRAASAADAAASISDSGTYSAIERLRQDLIHDGVITP